MGDTVTLREVQKALKATCLTANPPLNREVAAACASDLMSDVLAFSTPKSVLLTSLVSPQSVRTAEVADLMAVCFTNNKKPSDETVQMAQDSNISLFVSPYSLFAASGRLYETGLPDCSDST